MKGGILLFTLIVAAIFSLVLVFYLHSEVAALTALKAQQNYAQARIMATIAREKAATVRFDRGTATFEKDKITVMLADGSSYRF